ncbi:MAG: prenyltransferase [Candidatus Micrarchaeota archaeon]|nr:prenyltransferase [Candidatus Micrarchaeota archaeon]
MNFFERLFIAIRLPFMVASMLPAFAAAALAFYDGGFSLPVFLAIAIAIFFSHAATNLANDYFDFKEGNYPPKKTGPTGGSFAIQNKLFSPQQIIAMAALFFAFSIVLFYAVSTFTGYKELFLLGLAGNFIGIAYSMPPFKLSYRNLGEIATFLGMGPILVSTVYLSQTGTITLGALMLSIFFGLLVSNILLAAQIPDIEIDKKTKKNTIASVWGEKVLAQSFLFSAFLGAFALLISVLYNILPAGSLLGVLSTIASVEAVKKMTSKKHIGAIQDSLLALQIGSILVVIGILTGVIW